MLIIALVLALIGLVALVFAVVTSNELVAWVCIGASILGVVLLIVDAVRERQRRDPGDETPEAPPADEAAAEAVDYPEEASDESAEKADDDDETVAAETRGEDSAK
jgi:hypothetical protein